MKKLILLVMSGMLLASCGGGGMSKEQIQLRNDSLSLELSHQKAEFDDMMATFTMVQEGFRHINEAENRLNMQGDGTTENPSSIASKISEDIAFITDKMAENKEQIKRLKQQLANSRGASANYKKAVAELQRQLEEKTREIEELRKELAAKNVRITELDNAVTTLNNNLSDLQEDNEQKTKVVQAQEIAINTAWFVFGTKSELKDQHIWQSGDVLKSADFNKDYFTEVDIRKMKELKLYAKRASLLTTHPDGSYLLERDEKKQLVLKIIKPNEFWSVSRYLVIRVR
ncbi:MAG: hypothetical protein WCQ82_07590 [Bacteroidaceae bacterium]|nr:hypothetical protein [Bacteroidaceae bacterium]